MALILIRQGMRPIWHLREVAIDFSRCCGQVSCKSELRLLVVSEEFSLQAESSYGLLSGLVQSTS